MTSASRVTALCVVAVLGVPQTAMCESSSAARPPVMTRDANTGARTIEVPAGGDLQAALDDARPGDTISLAAGATFVGPFTLPNKRGTSWIVIRGAAVDRLPPQGTRVTPQHARDMPKLEARSSPVLATAASAHHYRIVGLEIRPSSGAAITEVVRFGRDRGQTLAKTPSHLVMDRCYVHGDPELGARRGLALNARDVEVTSSYFADFKEVGADSQAIAGWNGPGPFRIVNNYLEAAGENVMFGGADPSLEGLVPSDIEIRGNHLSKPLAWKTAPGRGGKAWTVKNLLELKNARRVVVRDNVLENNWEGAQNGFAVLLTVRNQDGRAPWSVVEDVTFSNNVVRHSASGISILGRDDNFPSQQTRRIRIENNLFEDIGGARWGGSGTLLQVIGGTADVRFDHNTAFHTGNVITADGAPHERFVFSNNIVQQNEYGIIGTGTGTGEQTLSRYFPGAKVVGNVFVGGSEQSYPVGNFFPASLREVGLDEPAHGWPRLDAASRYRAAATDGRDVGAVRAAMSAAKTAGPK